MKPLEVQTHYETLEIPENATPEQIERAYRMVRSSYDQDSLALYSVFDQNDAEVIRERIDLAYRVLSDSQTREEYDRSVLGRAGEAAGAEAPAPQPAEPVSEAQPLPPIEAFEEIDEGPEGSDYDGSRLRRARMHRGIEIDQVAAITKINPSYLRFIEDDAYDDLPAPVYVRGFVTAYARAIGLDGPQVAASYIARLEESRTARRPSRLLGRR
ncbi:MAG: helix-turn-helix domain-containing protein [Myxococcota bacterium]